LPVEPLAADLRREDNSNELVNQLLCRTIEVLKNKLCLVLEPDDKVIKVKAHPHMRSLRSMVDNRTVQEVQRLEASVTFHLLGNRKRIDLGDSIKNSVKGSPLCSSSNIHRGRVFAART
jgi:hypothetical protein